MKNIRDFRWFYCFTEKNKITLRISSNGVARIFCWNWEHFKGLSCERSAVRAPGAGKFSKIWKILRKLLERHYFSIFTKKFRKPCVRFWHVWTKNISCWAFCESPEGFWWKFNGKVPLLNSFWKLLLKIALSDIA